ncbi:hypothetical protein AGLY_008598 [Aphis glycines]|uniref:Uncharacterized protein n=1 Tax=Aphis glycines TaxID=307491 RepID=A0A6G0TKG2_APHGL|nr:hypothetical protein AGLY_008598 [Aphis glycines]
MSIPIIRPKVFTNNCHDLPLNVYIESTMNQSLLSTYMRCDNGSHFMIEITIGRLNKICGAKKQPQNFKQLSMGSEQAVPYVFATGRRREAHNTQYYNIAVEAQRLCNEVVQAVDFDIIILINHVFMWYTKILLLAIPMCNGHIISFPIYHCYSAPTVSYYYTICCKLFLRDIKNGFIKRYTIDTKDTLLLIGNMLTSSISYPKRKNCFVLYLLTLYNKPVEMHNSI